ncbi:hypothetical protein SDRG_01719 [Saprolegnia diclina VS20]|uniref:Mitochondrial splicing suppressor 51-like C-terminal domain-containing protein n=1 Tax=Saprolegnia diclina (strain VS20) TaxID=1156394 RepID=T0S689_SAPDV|nr:hypothetical protein SDRG_01719 [Saprolegnia diclina VS20]EQC40638.1 hypothetical protein SDRG_01719 [Saprolegnia diclina VS20]|eukprot:XP_008605482.1 hypothetical protein SDRG_01719 [Saprolegnia diclina VS20]
MALGRVWRRRWPAIRGFSSQPPTYWSFPCPICGGSKGGDVLACSPACAATLERDHAGAHAKLLTLKDDADAAKSPALHDAIKRLAAHKGSDTYASWEALLAAIDAPLSDPAAIRLLSAAYSYPMTLHHYLPDLCAASEERVALYVLGARAEATMPKHMWGVLNPHRVHLKMVGNHVPVFRKLPPESSDDAVHVSFSSSLFHEMAPSTPSPNAFVLFNPGLGHPALSSLWAPTLSMALATRKPLLITCFSAIDLHRDLTALEASATTLSGRLHYTISAQLNPFQSRKATVDPAALLAPVHTNQYAMVVRLTA